MRTIAFSIVLLASAALLACERPRFRVGEGCEVNSDCSAPLVCVIGACRRQCVDSRDCGAGLRCLVIDPDLGGGCQIDEESQCTLNSDCARSGDGLNLVCQTGTCTTPCREDRDCARGATCSTDDAGVLGCFEETTELCVYNTDCPAPMVCGRDQLCHLECITTRDCPIPRTCIDYLCELPDGG